MGILAGIKKRRAWGGSGPGDSGNELLTVNEYQKQYQEQQIK
jgi:hypothetical protein